MTIFRQSFSLALVLLTLSTGWLALANPAGAELAIPDSPAGQQLAWALDQVGTGAAGTTTATIREHFSVDYLDVVTEEQLLGYFSNYLYANGPFEIIRWEGGATELRNNAIMLGPNGYWRVELTVTPDDHKIDLLWFEPVYTTTTPDVAPSDWSAMKREFATIAPQVSVTIGEVHDGNCDPIARVEPDLILPIASSFKLYVLGEAARQVSAGQASWDEMLAIDPEYISQPNGEMRYLPIGSEYTLAYFAEQMISKSDNTATDHLIHRLGRDQVEQSFAAMGQIDPQMNVPLMLTREWFALRMRFTDEQIDAYLAADDAGKLQILENDADPVADTIEETEEWPGQHWANDIEWFASSGDLCRALAILQNYGVQPGMDTVLNALSLKPEIVFDPAVWSYVGYKGGYETGVMSENFLLQRASDGRWFAISAVIMDPAHEINGDGLRNLIDEAVENLAYQP